MATWQSYWRPTCSDQLASPRLPAEAPLDWRLLLATTGDHWRPPATTGNHWRPLATWRPGDLATWRPSVDWRPVLAFCVMVLWRYGVMPPPSTVALWRYDVMGLPASLRYSVMAPDRRCSITPWGAEARGAQESSSPRGAQHAASSPPLRPATSLISAARSIG
eukprot:2564519-Prymnesium_polylepis.1